ncbi:MAG TPA: hypothetical protein VHD76_06220 [Bryobacteraceae bacterium]|jgi:hypothetical protein|nr:hypothetical protein [Bryobacteraceae bacterium]
MLRRNPDAVAMVIVVLWTLAAPMVHPVMIHERAVAGIQMVLSPLRHLRMLAIPSLDLCFER